MRGMSSVIVGAKKAAFARLSMADRVGGGNRPVCANIKLPRAPLRRSHAVRKNIALVDDDRNILTSVSMLLEAEGFQVKTYSDGASALEGLNQTPPDMA